MTMRIKNKYRWLLFCFVFSNFVTIRAQDEDVNSDSPINLLDGINDNGEDENNNNNTTLNPIFTENFEKIKDEPFIPPDLAVMVEVIGKIKEDQCQKDLQTVLKAFQDREMWALRMFDASAKFPVGLLDGAFYQLGDFDECIEVEHHQDNDEIIQGQYCLIDIDIIGGGHNGRVERSSENKPRIRHAFNSTVHWAVCLPSSCNNNNNDISTLVNDVILKRTGHRNFIVNVEANKCHVKKTEPITALEIIYSFIIGIILICSILATAFHYYIIEDKKKSPTPLNVETARECNNNNQRFGPWTEYIICFSLIKNTKNFLHVKPSDQNLECICGIKLISMIFIIIGHSLIFTVGGPILNPDYYTKAQQSLLAGPFVNNPLLVDTFLMISGFLFCFLLIAELQKRQGKVNFAILYVARYIRLTPSYFVVLGFYCSWLFRIGSGPLWDSRIGLERDRCLSSWWANLLYINNYVFTDKICMFQSWYLAVDYHLFIIAPIVVYPLWRWEKIGKSLLGVIIFVTVLIPFVVTLLNNLDPTLMTFAPEIGDLANNYYFIVAYIKTHMRASSYFIGIFFGYLIAQLQSKAIKISNKYIYSGWFISSLFGILSMYSVVVFYLPDHEYNPIESAIYGAFHRIAWCIFVGWVLLVCITDHAETINRFLSWKPFVPLSRLTYCAYLVNGIIELCSFGTARVPVYMSSYELLLRTTSHVLITFLLAFVLCITCESPIHAIEKILLRRDKTKHIQRNVSVESLDEN